MPSKQEVANFIRSTFRSVWALELLCFLRQHEGRSLSTGEMVAGPRGFLGYHGPTPGYTQVVRSYGRVLKLKVRRVLRRGDDVVVE